MNERVNEYRKETAIITCSTMGMLTHTARQIIY